MDRRDVAEALAKPIAQELLGSSIPARLAYVGADGGPRVIPIGCWWTGAALVMATTPNAPKVPALRARPNVAITIDRLDPWPPRMLLIRGAARLEEVDGVPDEYIEGGRKVTPADLFEDWERGVRELYERMVLVSVEPTWAKLIDFETTLPSPVEELMRARASGEGRLAGG
ncbi:pyridoxamine 5'-phosphate oxidase-related protein FMN-binding [Beutenbergia cavernae DSM 12333]|uniref:Pyridoxamine 5'-phosphate oxidase-related protein FMN-binding n=1 Tax=Beutenbergia cavernae (strain ATCC BAA-8 / DSM 12333 / CCUG 43141 / JCM 11478 / NBRC 16432 / NCIMB 13614 / HKI 0122) TaxID=471853 RepID=C5C643_BEUC1|nr:pyridoxamine 5'-phosphate oxidase family protein [Beutenbergia cavernae]ACQ82401.1 pyridoxamine 5'-phosphate oxidase-related protein FMN-binding [Beutenbergia cavernae DSM 12333]